MRILDFFAGTGSATQAFKDAGHEVIRVEIDPRFEAEEDDVMKLDAEYLTNTYGQFDFIWASPPCTSFSVASIGYHWKDNKPSDQALHGIELVLHTIDLIKDLKPTFGWLIENPRGLLRIQPFMQSLPRQTITYCQYGEKRMKPTDLWGVVKGWTPRPACKNGDKCHEAAPRGSRTGTQGITGWVERSKIPYELSKELLEAIENAD